MNPKIDPKIDAKIDTKNYDFLDPLKKSADPSFWSDLAPPPLPNLPPILQVKAPRASKTSIASLSCAELRSASRHPPTPSPSDRGITPLPNQSPCLKGSQDKTVHFVPLRSTALPVIIRRPIWRRACWTELKFPIPDTQYPPPNTLYPIPYMPYPTSHTLYPLPSLPISLGPEPWPWPGALAMA